MGSGQLSFDHFELVFDLLEFKVESLRLQRRR